jgi:hypothetical protein
VTIITKTDDQVPIYGKGSGFYIRRRIQTHSGANTAAYPLCTRGSFPETEQPKHETKHSIPSRVEVMNAWMFASILPDVLML